MLLACYLHGLRKKQATAQMLGLGYVDIFSEINETIAHGGCSAVWETGRRTVLVASGLKIINYDRSFLLLSGWLATGLAGGHAFSILGNRKPLTTAGLNF